MRAVRGGEDLGVVAARWSASVSATPTADPLTLIGRPGDAADSARDFLARNGVPLRWIDLDHDPLAAMLPREELDAASLPLAIFADGSRLEAPRTYIERTAGLDFSTLERARASRTWHADLARGAGLPTHPRRGLYDVVIVGAGRPGGDELEDRELSGLSGRDRRR